jgi:hypothetical protein
MLWILPRLAQKLERSDATVADLFAQNTILFNQVFDDLVLPLVHPTSDRDD